MHLDATEVDVYEAEDCLPRATVAYAKGMQRDSPEEDSPLMEDKVILSSERSAAAR